MIQWLQALTIGEVITALIALGGIAAGLRWIHPIMTGIHDFLSDWKGEPARPGVEARPGVLAQIGDLRCDLEGVKTDVEQIKADAASAAFNSQPNHDSSSHDALVREIRDVRSSVATISGQVLAMSREQTRQGQRQEAIEVAVRNSIDDRAEIREHVGLEPIDPDPLEQKEFTP